MSNLSIVEEAFAELASDYRQTMDRELREFWGISYQEFIDRFLEHAGINPTDLVLDVATGTAFIPTQLVGKFGGAGRIVGLDLTPAMLNKGQEIIARQDSRSSIWLVCASGMDLPFLNQGFDGVLCALGTHHMDVPLLLAEAHRVLKTGGKFLMTDVGATPFWRSIVGRLVLALLLLQYRLTNRNVRAQAEAEAFANVRTSFEWQELLTRHGFREIEIKEVPSRRPWYPCGLMIQAIRSSSQ